MLLQYPVQYHPGKSQCEHCRKGGNRFEQRQHSKRLGKKRRHCRPAGPSRTSTPAALSMNGVVPVTPAKPLSMVPAASATRANSQATIIELSMWICASLKPGSMNVSHTLSIGSMVLMRHASIVTQTDRPGTHQDRPGWL